MANSLPVPWLTALVSGFNGLPAPRVERWKYSNLRGLTTTPAATRLVSGLTQEFMQEIKTPTGWNWASARPQPVAALVGRAQVDGDRGLNQARMGLPHDGLDALLAAAPRMRTLHIAAGPVVQLNLNYAYSAGLGVDVLHLHVAPGAVLHLHETLNRAQVPWVCQGLVLHVGAGAVVHHRLNQTLPPEVTLTRRELITLENKATYHRGTVQRGAGFSRIEPLLEAAEACDIQVRTLHQTGWGVVGQLHDTTTQVAHIGPGTRTEIHQRNVVDGDGVAVFQGKFFVAQAAQQTDAYMRCQNLLLADTAKAHHKPELEIYADDVKCSHGASTGGLDAQQLFYLQARGLGEAAARALLLQGFMDDMLAAMPLNEGI
jgi:Fe-S cluster assembly protein SufD